MKKILSMLIVVTLLVTMVGCKSNEDKANDYVSKGQYKEAYDLLYDLDEDHSKADDCLLSWALECVSTKEVDDQMSGLKFVNKEYADKLFKRLKTYSAEGYNPTLKQCEMIVALMPLMEDLYDGDSEYLQFKSSIYTSLKYEQDNDVIDKYQQNGQYKQAYEYACDIDLDDGRANKALLKWYDYCIKNNIIDDELLEIDINSEETAEYIYQSVEYYLYSIRVVNKEQSEALLVIMDKIYDYMNNYETDYLFVRRSLQHSAKGECIWDIPEQSTVSYEQYYSTIHYYSDDDINSAGDKIVGQLFLNAAVNIYDENYELIDNQYCVYGNFSNSNTYRSIGNDYGFDGYWFYYIDTTVPQVCRMNIYGETQVILTSEELNGKSPYSAIVVASDILYTYVQDGDNVTIYRVYLPDKTIDSYTTESSIDYYFKVLVPKDSEHLRYYHENPEYVAKLSEFKNDKEALYELISKYEKVNKEYYDETSIDEILSWHSLLEYSIKQEYGIRAYCYYDYDLKTKELTVTPTDDSYRSYEK